MAKRLPAKKYINVNPMKMAAVCPRCGEVEVINNIEEYKGWINKGKVCNQKHSTHLELH